jgi:hypothetical protein
MQKSPLTKLLNRLKPTINLVFTPSLAPVCLSLKTGAKEQFQSISDPITAPGEGDLIVKQQSVTAFETQIDPYLLPSFCLFPPSAF